MNIVPARLRHFFRRIYTDSRQDASGLFPRGFLTPFDSPIGIVHEVYSVRECGKYAKLALGCLIHKPTVSHGLIYEIRAEIEVPMESDLLCDPEFIISPGAFLKSHPHSLTKRVVTFAWVTDQTLIKQAL